MVVLKFENEIEPIYKLNGVYVSSSEFFTRYGYYVEDVVLDNSTAYNLRKIIDWDFTKQELDDLTIIREFQNLNSSFRNSLNPVKDLIDDEGDIFLKDFLNVRLNIFKKGFYKNKAIWGVKFNYKIFKAPSTDLYFLKINFKKTRHFLWFFAVMGLIKSNWTYKGEFTKKERKLIYKLKNPIKREFVDFEDLQIEISIKRDLLKKLDTDLSGLLFNKWENWHEIGEKSRQFEKEKKELKRLLNIKESWEDSILNTNRIWE